MKITASGESGFPASFLAVVVLEYSEGPMSDIEVVVAQCATGSRQYTRGRGNDTTAPY